MADSQDIEAKLAAYVDGELPPEQRAEIEKYLSANPQQRRLIADLMRQRDVLRDLPKTSAPPDVAETLNAQLERSVLLDGGDSAHVAGTIRPWRSLAAVAAAVLLVSALGLTIYSLLPSPNRKPPDLASMQTIPASRPSAEEVFSTAPEPMPKISEQELRARSALKREEPPADAPPAPLGRAAVSGDAGIEQAAPPTVQPSAAPPAAMEAAPPSGIGGGATLADAAAADSPALTTLAKSAESGPAATTLEAVTPGGPPPFRTETIDIAAVDAVATRRQIANTLTALGGRVESPATAPADTNAAADTTLTIAVPPQDLDRAAAVARSFQAAAPLVASNALDAATQPTPDLNSNANLSQLQSLPVAAQGVQAPPPPATLPTETVTVRILPLLPVAAPLPATAVDASPSTFPASHPATEPTTQP